MLTEKALVEFLIGQCDAAEADITSDVSLFQSGLLDSFSMVDLIQFVETSAGIRIRPSEVSLSNLDTIKAIMRFVALKQDPNTKGAS